LPREEWAKPRGRKFHRCHCGLGGRGEAGLRPDQANESRGVRVRRTAFRRCGSERAVHTRSRAVQAKKRETWRAERQPVLTEAADVGAWAGDHMVGIGRSSCRPKRARGRRCGATSNDDRYQDQGNRETTKAHARRQRSSWWLNSPRRRAGLVCMETWAQAVPPIAIGPGTANHSRHHSFGIPKCRGSVNVKADACRWSGE
jgi:hypothetical protein